MTVNSTTSRVSYAGNGSTTAFVVPFYFLAAADLTVIRTSSTGAQTTLVLNTDYTVSGAGVPSGGTVTCTAAPAAGTSLVILRAPAETQLTDYQPNDPFPAETHERALDKLTMIAQRQKDLIGRSFRLSDGDTTTASTTLPTPQSNHVIGWNATATGLQNVTPQTLATIVSTGTSYADVFTGNGTQTAFVLTSNPANQANLDVAVGGVTQLPGIDFIWVSGTTVTFTTAPPNGVKILIRYTQALAQQTGDAASITFQQSGTLRTRTLQAKIRESNVSPRDFGAVGDGVTNDHDAFLDWAASVNASGCDWIIPEGEYLLNGNTTINLREGGKCFGTLIIPKDNHSVRIVFERDSAGVVLNTSSWTSMNRGSLSANALNAAGKYLNITSTLTLIERDGNPANPYLKQEFIRVAERNANFTTPLVHSYGVPVSPTVVVTAYTPSRPIIVDNLRIVRRGAYGGTESFLGCLRVERDNATFNNFELLNENQSQPLAVGVDVIRCADVVFNSPRISGLQFAGTGYGINLSNTIGFVCNYGTFIDCRHCISGRHNVDMLLNGGNYAGGIDDHWGDRMVIESPVITVGQGGSAIQYAGNDIVIRNPTVINGRNLLSIRADTPQIGGDVQILNPKVITKGELGFYYMFGFTSPDPTQTGFTTLPRMPDSVVIENPVIDTTTSLTYIMYLGWLQAQNFNWGDMRLVGNLTASTTTQVVGIFMWKDATYQTGRAARLTVDGPMDFGTTGVAAYVASINANASLASTISVNGLIRGNLRFSPYGVIRATVTNSSIGYVENDNGITVFGSSLFTFNSCTMIGGYISSTFRNIAFYNCTFTGLYSAFPYDGVNRINYATLVGNTRTTAQANMPPDIRNNVVSPFASLSDIVSVPLTNCKRTDGSSVDATFPTGGFGTSVTVGTSTFLRGANAISNTVTSTGIFEATLPSTYVAGSPLTITVNAEHDGSGTQGATRSLSVACYRVDNVGAHGTNIVTTSAQTFSFTATDYAFSVTPTTLSPGDRIVMSITMQLQETGGVALFSRINSVRIS